jgi:hypothetical protein
MNLLAFSDTHRDRAAIEAMRSLAAQADLLVGAGDFATARVGLEPVVDAIPSLGLTRRARAREQRVGGELRAAAGADGHLHVLHGQAFALGGVTCFALGGAAPETPFGKWRVDLSEH